jgi:NDMA-dependent alcohol dehydrogenase
VKVKAAVLYEPGTKCVIEEIELDPPQAGEVMVKISASGMCHSDEHLFTGDLAMPPEMEEEYGMSQYPVILGHEGAGVVTEVGPGVTDLEPGDHVVMSFVPVCGKCPSCTTGHTNLCDTGAGLMLGRQLDGTSRHHTAAGEDLALMCCLGTLAEYTVVNVNSVVKVSDHYPSDKAALVGCGVPTGWGSVVYAAEVQAGETVVVVGVGGVGMNAVQAAANAGARFVVAVDPVEFKRDLAIDFGATHVAASLEEATALVEQITWGQFAEKSILTVGVATGDLIAPLMALTSKGGRAVVTSAANMMDVDVQLSLFDLTMSQKQLVGAVFGGANPRFDIPRLLGLYDAGKLKLDELITRTYTLDQVNEGFQDMRDGRNIRGVVIP